MRPATTAGPAAKPTRAPSSLTSFLVLGVLAVGLFATTAPQAEAVTLFCNSAKFMNSFDYRHSFPTYTPSYNVRYVKPDFNGEVYFPVGYLKSQTSPARNQFDSVVYNQNKNCGTDWSQAFTCPNNDGATQFQCVYSMPIPDPAGGISNFAKTTTGVGATIGQSHQRLSPATGSVYPNDAIPPYELAVGDRFGAQNSAAHPTDGDGYILNGVVYKVITSGTGCCSNGLGGGDTTIRVFDDDSLAWSVSAPAGLQRPVAVTAQSGIATPYAFLTGGATASPSPGSSSFVRLNLVDHTFTSTILGGTGMIGYSPLRQGYGADSAQIFGVHNGAICCNKVVVEKIAIDAWTTTSETELLIGGLSWGTTATLNDWDIDGNNNFLLCGTNGAGTVLKLYKGDLAAAKIAEIYSEAMPGDFVGSFYATSCKFDYDGGFHVMAQGGCTGPGAAGSSNCMIHKRFLSGADFTNPAYPKNIDTTIYAGLDDGGGGGLTNTNNPVSAVQAYFADSWGISFEAAGWMFGLLIMSLFMFAILKRSSIPLVVAIFALLGVGLCMMLGLFPEWLLFVLVFLIIAVAGTVLFASRNSGGDEGA